MIRFASWNINSVRLRLPNLLRFLSEFKPDVVSLQETKTLNTFFPLNALAEAGYPYYAIEGMKGYNGVAILSKYPLQDIQVQNWCGKNDARHISAKVEGMDIHNLYIPAGGDIPDPQENPKFAHKLNFIEKITNFFEEKNLKAGTSIIMGDLNIAPLENDVWSHKQLLDVVSHTPIEVDLLTKLQQKCDFEDAIRTMVKPSEKLYSWWSYRSPDWSKSDRGRRLDHIWVTQKLAGKIKDGQIIKEMRSWESPSDHVPVILDLTI
jgi:exodeoxyribonuclease-3